MRACTFTNTVGSKQQLQPQKSRSKQQTCAPVPPLTMSAASNKLQPQKNRSDMHDAWQCMMAYTYALTS
jgi:hypothetical protein